MIIPPFAVVMAPGRECAICKIKLGEFRVKGADGRVCRRCVGRIPTNLIISRNRDRGEEAPSS